jgi:hypothetical protein
VAVESPVVEGLILSALSTRSNFLWLKNISFVMDVKMEDEGHGYNVVAVENIPPKHAEGVERLAGKDKAAELLQHANKAVIVTPEENARILRKIDLTILPILLAVYFLQGLDKATLSYASVFGLVKDAHLVGQDYSWLGSIVYVAQLVLQPPVAYFLVKLPTVQKAILQSKRRTKLQKAPHSRCTGPERYHHHYHHHHSHPYPWGHHSP